MLTACGGSDDSGNVIVIDESQKTIEELKQEISNGQISTTNPTGADLAYVTSNDSIVFHIMPDSTFTTTIYGR